MKVAFYYNILKLKEFTLNIKCIIKFLAYKLYEYTLICFYFWFCTYIPYAAFAEYGMKEVGFIAGCAGFMFSWLLMLYAIKGEHY